MSFDIVSHNVSGILLTLWLTMWEDCEKIVSEDEYPYSAVSTEWTTYSFSWVLSSWNNLKNLVSRNEMGPFFCYYSFWKSTVFRLQENQLQAMIDSYLPCRRPLFPKKFNLGYYHGRYRALFYGATQYFGLLYTRSDFCFLIKHSQNLIFL